MDSIGELNMYKHLEHVFIDVMKRLREELSELEEANYMSLTMEAEGRINDGDLKISFILTDGSYGSTAKAEGGNLQSVVFEFMRRFEWKSKNAPLCLPKVEDNGNSD